MTIRQSPGVLNTNQGIFRTDAKPLRHEARSSPAKIHNVNSMSNCETCVVSGIQIFASSSSVFECLGDALKSLVHTVLLNRSLGHIAPVERTSEFLVLERGEELVWCENGEEELRELVDREVARVAQSEVLDFVRESSTQSRYRCSTTFEVLLRFFEKKKEQSTSWFGRPSARERQLTWEKWVIPFEVLFDTTPAEDHEPAKAKNLKQVQFELVSELSLRREHIPPVVAGQGLTFPFDLGVQNLSCTIVDTETGATTSHQKSSGIASYGMDMVKKVLSSTQPPSILQ